MTQSKLKITSIDWGSIFRNETFLYVVKRLLQAALTLLIASALCFIVINLTPDNCLSKLKDGNPRITEDTIKQLTREFGLDQPAYIQYGKWLWQVITQFNFGQSCTYYRPVSDLILERIPNTLFLSIVSIIATWAIAIPLGILSAVKQNSFLDRTLRVLSYLGQGFPSFIPAIALLLFAQLTTPLFPVGNMTSIYHENLPWFAKIVDILWHSILPTIALSITGFAGLQRLTRGQLLDVLRQEYIQTARAKGLPENKVIYTHALRNAINPLITLLGFEFASLLGGAFIAEQFFNWPGLGRLTLQAVYAKDVPVVMATLMMGAVMLIFGNLLADLLLKAVDPRIKLEDLK
jgi:peptide/nickel transport system permease protein